MNLTTLGDSACVSPETVPGLDEMPIETLPGLSDAVAWRLKFSGLKTVGELSHLTQEQLLSIPYISEARAAAIRTALEALVMGLGAPGPRRMAEELGLEPNVVETVASWPITSVDGIPTRCLNALARLGIETVGEVLHLSDSAILSTHNMGAGSAEALKSALRAFMRDAADGTVAKPSWSQGSVGHEWSVADLTEDVLEYPVVLLPGMGQSEVAMLIRSGFRTINQFLCSPSGKGGMASLSRSIRRSVMEAIGQAVKDGMIADMSNEALADVPLRRGDFRELEKHGVRTVGQLIEAAYRRSDDLFVRILGQTGPWRVEAHTRNQLTGLAGFVEEVLSGLTERECFIVTSRFGIHDGDEQTLEEVGEELGVTRERVRQIQARALTKLNEARLRNRAFQVSEAVLRIADECTEVATSRDDLMIHLSQAGLRDVTAVDLPYVQFLVDLGWVEVPPGIRVDMWSPLPIIRERKRIGEVIQLAEKYARNVGAAHITAVATAAGAPEDECAEILASSGLIREDKAWFVLPQPAKPFLSAVRVMHVYCGDCLPLRVIRNGLRKRVSRRTQYKQMPLPPSKVIGRALGQSREFATHQGASKWRPTVEVDDTLELSGATAELISLFDVRGPALSFPDIHEGLTQAGYSSATVTAVLGSSPLVRKLEFSLYCRFGHEVSLADIANVRARRRTVAADSCLTFTRSGKIVFEMNVGGFAESGVLSRPELEQLRGQWPLEIEGRECGELRIRNSFAHGLSGAFEILDVKRGDRIRLEFDTARHIVSLSVSSKAADRIACRRRSLAARPPPAAAQSLASKPRLALLEEDVAERG